MAREKKIRPITNQDIKAIIENSVQGKANRLVGNAADQKAMFVRPIVNTDNSPSIDKLLNRVVADAEAAIDELALDVPLAFNFVPEFGKLYAEIKADYEANKAVTNEANKDEIYKADSTYSVWYTNFSKAPDVGELFTATGTSKDGYVFGFKGRVVEGGNTVRFAFDDLVLFHNPDEIALVCNYTVGFRDRKYSWLKTQWENKAELVSNGVKAESFSRVPRVKDNFFALGIAEGGEIFSFSATVTRTAVESGISYAWFKIVDMDLLHDPIVDTVARVTPITLKSILQLGWGNHEYIETNQYSNSLPASLLPRPPKQGDTISGFLKTTDNYVYSFLASVKEEVNASGYVSFTITSVVRVYTPVKDSTELNEVIETAITPLREGIKQNAFDIFNLAESKQDNLVFDGEYSPESNKVATVKTVTDKIADLINGADESFDTLKEISDWINEHPESVAEINKKIQENTVGVTLNAAAIVEANTAIQDLSNNTTNKFLEVDNSIKEKTEEFTEFGNTTAERIKKINANIEETKNSISALSTETDVKFALVDKDIQSVSQSVSTLSEATDKKIETVNKSISGLQNTKQDNLVFDGTYNAESNKVATVKTVTDKIADLINGADESFDTLKEISDWINEHPESVAEINKKIQENIENIQANAAAISILNGSVDTLGKVKQDAADNTLQTTEKTVVGAINEVDTNVNTHVGITDGNPHGVTKAMLGVVETYNNEEPLLNNIGGILASAHTNGFKDVPITDLITELLYPYTAPVINSFSLNPTAGVKEMNVALTVKTATVTVAKKSKSLRSINLYKGSKLVESKTDGVASGGTFTFNINEKLDGSADTTYKVTVVEAGEDGATITSNDQTYAFVYPYFYGVIAENTEINSNVVLSFTKSIRAKGSHSYSYTTNNQCPVIAYPASYVALKSIVDANGFPQTWTRSTVEVNNGDTINGVEYYVYVGGAATAAAFTY